MIGSASIVLKLGEFEMNTTLHCYFHVVAARDTPSVCVIILNLKVET